MKFPQKVFKRLAKKLETIAYLHTQREFRVKAAPGHDIAYTREGNEIFLGLDNEFIPEEEHGVIFLTGAFAHELLHQILTPFLAHNTYLNRFQNPVERRIFHMLFNLVEDPAIEFQSRRYFDGKLLDSLRYMIDCVYRKLPDIDPSDSPFSQYLSAVCQYGNGGLLKGNITDPTAKDIFVKTLPILNEAIEDEDGEHRLVLTRKIMDETKPLWEPELQRQQSSDDLMSMLQALMDAFGNNENGSGDESARGSASPGENGQSNGESSISRRRNITIRHITQEEADQLPEATSDPSSIPPDGDLEILIVDGEKKDDSDSSSSASVPVPCSNGESSDETSSDDSTDGDGTADATDSSDEGNDAGTSGAGSDNADRDDEGDASNDATGNGSMGAGNGDNTSSASQGQDHSNPDGAQRPDAGTAGTGESTSSAAAQNSASASAENYGQSQSETESDAELAAEYEIDSETVASALQDWEQWRDAEPSADTVDKPITDNLNIPSLRTAYPFAPSNVINRPVTLSAGGDYEEVYKNIANDMRADILKLARQLAEIFRNDCDEHEYRANGKLHLERCTCNPSTPRVFTRRNSGEIGDVAVYLMIDLSGSMSGEKCAQAKAAAIAVAEVFARLGVPLKVVGFHEHDNKVVQEHFIHWRNSQTDRYKLLGITASGCNMDGYSIRYAAESLKKRPEARKILIALTDGQPASHWYKGRDAGIADTKDAIRKASKTCSVVGIGIGSAGTIPVWESMYGKNFFHCQNPQDLFDRIAKVIKRTLK